LNAKYPVKITELKVPFQRAMTWLRQFDAYRIVMGAASWTNWQIDFPMKISTTRQTFHCRLKWIERSLRAHKREGRKVRTP